MNKWETKSGCKIIKILSGRSNVFLLTNGDKNILIDTSPANKWRKLERRLRKHHIDHIEYLILTHSHYDHTGNTSRIKSRFGSQVILHRNEEYYLKTGEIIVPKGTNPVTRFIINYLASKVTDQLKFEPCQPDILVDSDFDLAGFGFNGRIVHTPGHSPGSVSIIIDDELAFVGDTMFGIFWWTVFPPFADDATQMVNSWTVLLATKCSIFLPSHGSSKNRTQLQKEFNKRKAICS
jgi:hydroxyacylglutathione hydrolase